MSDSNRRNAPVPPVIAPGGRGGGAPRGNAKQTASRPKSGGGGGTSFGLLAIIALMLVGGAWFGYIQSEQLKLARADLIKADTRLKVLEDQLSITERKLTINEEDLINSGQSLESQIKFWESEIRKLWHIANKRNKDAIAANTKLTSSLDKSAKAQATTLKDATTQLTALTAAVGDQKTLQTQLETLTKQGVALGKAQRDLVDQTNVLQRSVNSLKTGLERRVVETEQAVKAFDAYRVQVNRRVNAIERSLSTGVGGDAAN